MSNNTPPKYNRLGHLFDGAELQAYPSSKDIGPRYRIEHKISKGGFGCVYKAWTNHPLDRMVAIKQFSRQMDFEQEIKILKRIKHQSIPFLIDAFQEDNNMFIVMEYIEGDSLQQKVDNNQSNNISFRDFSILDVIDYGCTILTALEYLHSRKPKPIIHRDIKPDNIRIPFDGETKAVLVDFGVAKDGTDTNVFGHTPSYCSPEQARRQPTDARSDIYSLGATLVFALTGKEYDRSIGEWASIRTLCPGISQELLDVITKATQLDKMERYANATEMLAALEKAREAHNYRLRAGTLLHDRYKILNIEDALKRSDIFVYHAKDTLVNPSYTPPDTLLLHQMPICQPLRLTELASNIRPILLVPPTGKPLEGTEFQGQITIYLDPRGIPAIHQTAIDIGNIVEWAEAALKTLDDSRHLPYFIVDDTETQAMQIAPDAHTLSDPDELTLATQHSHLYSLGTLMYHALTGRQPDKDSGKLFPASHYNQHIPPLLDEMLSKTLAHNSEQWYQHPKNMLQELGRLKPIWELQRTIAASSYRDKVLVYAGEHTKYQQEQLQQCSIPTPGSIATPNIKHIVRELAAVLDAIPDQGTSFPFYLSSDTVRIDSQGDPLLLIDILINSDKIEPLFKLPELRRTERTDVYLLAILSYELLANPRFYFPSSRNTIEQVAVGIERDLRDTKVQLRNTNKTAKILATALAFNPADRFYLTCYAFADALIRSLD